MINKIALAIKLLVIGFILSLLLLSFLAIAPKTDNTPLEAQWICGNSSISIPSVSEEMRDSIYHIGSRLFRTNCNSCHAMHKKVIGPALSGVMRRRDSLWVIKLIRNNEALMTSGDTTAINLYKEYKQTEHTKFEAMKDSDMENLLHFLSANSTTW